MEDTRLEQEEMHSGLNNKGWTGHDHRGHWGWGSRWKAGHLQNTRWKGGCSEGGDWEGYLEEVHVEQMEGTQVHYWGIKRVLLEG